MPSHSRNKKRNTRPPPTREAEYKVMIDIVNDVCLEIRKFAKMYINGLNLEYDTCAACLDELMASWNMDASQFSTSKEFWEKNKIKLVDESIRKKQAYKDLVFICERARTFEHMIPNIRESLVECARDHLYKYCRSFIEETYDEVQIRPIIEYEELITTSKKEIDQKIDSLNNNILKYGEMKSPFRDFISKGNIHAALMEEISVLNIEIAHAIKKWIADDASYPERLLQEVFFNNSYKENLVENIRKLEEEKQVMVKNLDKKHRVNYSVMRDHAYHKKEKHKLKNSLETVNFKIEKLEKQIEGINIEINDLKEAVADKTPIAPRDRQELRRKLEKAEADLDRLEERKDVMERQHGRLDKELKRISDRTYELKVELVTNRHDQEEMKQGILGVEIEMKSILERLSSIDEKQEILKRVRELKLSPDTLRRINTRKQEVITKGRRLKVQLDDACRYVAFHIGRDWKKLYDRLPFVPPRDPDRRQRDVEVIDNISARQDRTPEESALRSLEKWRSFNRQGDIIQLIRGLRKLNKVELAQKLESKFTIQNVYN
uniref:Filamin A-interacting protein 1-like isoform X2 n=1 Tax=Crassostrea virginica TaxID=6565 RepID=A0A8B8D629_CRAVI|nr:filamin A-interacting protein 1-like isoform X2 [Crassostrea virginica]